MTLLPSRERLGVTTESLAPNAFASAASVCWAATGAAAHDKTIAEASNEPRTFMKFPLLRRYIMQVTALRARGVLGSSGAVRYARGG